MNFKVNRNTTAKLEELANEHRHVIVMYSGGKDSLVVMSLADKYFDDVTALHMEFIPNLDYTKELIQEFIRLWPNRNYKIIRHLSYYDCRKIGFYCFNGPEWDDVIVPGQEAVNKAIMDEIGATAILDGCKRTDFMARRLAFIKGNMGTTIHPLEHWNKFDVLAYLKRHNIPIPEPVGGKEAGAYGINIEAILWMHDRYHGDYLKLREHFPFIEAIIKRREYYGDN